MMMNCSLDKGRIENAVIKVSEEVESRNRQISDWKTITEEELWHELVSCILGSRVKYETAEAFARHLVTEGLLTKDEIVKNPPKSERKIRAELRSSFDRYRYPFPRTKAHYIIETCINIYGDRNCSVKQLLSNSADEYDAREQLVNRCLGIGHKQASLFLRNIRYGENLAILDTHVLNYMTICGMAKPIKTGITKRKYLEYEKLLQGYACSFNKTLAQLDIAIWIVMRVIRREFSNDNSSSSIWRY